MRPAFTSSQYTSPNHTEANTAWQAIQPGHGVVAVSHEWAAQRQLPATMDLPMDSNMSVYVIEGYHALHCIVRIALPFHSAQTDNLSLENASYYISRAPCRKDFDCS